MELICFISIVTSIVLLTKYFKKSIKTKELKERILNLADEPNNEIIIFLNACNPHLILNALERLKGDIRSMCYREYEIRESPLVFKTYPSDLISPIVKKLNYQKKFGNDIGLSEYKLKKIIAQGLFLDFIYPHGIHYKPIDLPETFDEFVKKIEEEFNLGIKKKINTRNLESLTIFWNFVRENINDVFFYFKEFHHGYCGDINGKLQKFIDTIHIEEDSSAENYTHLKLMDLRASLISVFDIVARDLRQIPDKETVEEASRIIKVMASKLQLSNDKKEVQDLLTEILEYKWKREVYSESDYMQIY